MRIAAALSQVRELARTAAGASERYGAGRLQAARRARRLRLRGGFVYRETLATGLLDPALDEAEALRHVSEHETTRLLDRLNPESLAALTAEKVIFYRWAAAHRLPVPELYGVVGRDGGWSVASGRPLVGEDDCAAFLAAGPDEAVVKPSDGHHGHGVRVLRREGAELVDLEGRRHSPAALARELLADPEHGMFVVQQRLRNNAALQRVFRSETLQTVRMTTFVTDEGEARLLHAYMRVALGGLNVDNIRGGATGNADAEVDVSTGALNGSFGTPVPGIEAIAGETLPDWEAACELVRRGARLMMPQRSFGWDVALTPHGPVLVEANRGYDPFPSRGFGELVRGMARATA